MTLQQRIAALNAAHIGRVPGEPPRPSPQIPTKRPDLRKPKSFNNPPENVNGSVTDACIGNRPAPPPLPVRRPPPPLPARNSSSDSDRRGSIDSVASSVATTGSARPSATTRASSNERVKAPAWGECELPAIASKVPPPTKTYTNERPKYVNRAPSSQTSVASSPAADRTPSQPALPPRLPPRKPSVDQQLSKPVVSAAELRKMPPVPTAADLQKAQKSALSWGMNKAQSTDPTGHVPSPSTAPTQPAPSQQSASNHTDTLSFFKSSANNFMSKHVNHSEPKINHTAVATPPPVPDASRPDLTAIQATKPKFGGVSQSSPVDTNVCLVCRDFSGPDNHATLFPRQNIRDLRTLAHDLTAPFPSHTDKARAIFVWLHHNIAYDVVSFFNDNVRGSTPESTLRSGLAVCEGYAGLFTNLATHAGMESVVISGHGKGYGYTPLAPGSSLPPYNAGHAWNAVRIDGGEWKLIDACWGSGHVQGKGMPYVAEFNPSYFSMSNEEFGIKHFPGNREHFFLPGGRQMSWEEYIQINPTHWPSMVEAPTIFSNAKVDYYISDRSVLPRSRKISVNHGGLVRFQFSLLCPHFQLDKHGSKGPPPVFFVMAEGVDGRNKDSIPMQYFKAPAGQGGDTWYVDIDSRELGAPGQTLTMFAVSRFGDRQDTRGMTVKEFVAGKGRVAMGFTGVAAWELVT